VVVVDPRLMPDGPAAGRECGTCTACCTVLAIAELQKPARWACDHVHCSGCRIYADRPQPCRDFNCAWLRGAIPGDDSLRPDRLGLLFDFFYSTATKKNRFVALELWKGAFDEAPAAALLREIAASREVELSYRDGTWRTIGTTGRVDR
jgi:coenzyme F420-reducing hydrogenase beta subunit